MEMTEHTLPDQHFLGPIFFSSVLENTFSP